MDEANRKIRVLVADDSALMRSILLRELEADGDIEVVGLARDGVEALEKARESTPDVLTLDVEMPRLNGLQVLEQLMRDSPLPVVMVSALTSEGADTTIRALELGAVDFVLKPTLHGVPAVQRLASELCAKVRLAAGARVRPGAAAAARVGNRGSTWQNKIVVIGSSTGGPRALHEVFSAFPEDISVPILVVQHMPPGFTRSLAERLNSVSALSVEEARPGVRIRPGQALMAAGGHHMVVGKDGTVHLDDRPAECGVRPSINVTMESAVASYGGSTLGVVLTGMGTDGTRGAGLIKAAGGEVIAEDASTCVVYGMPRSVIEAGHADCVAPVTRIAAEISSRCQAEVRRQTA